MIIECNSCQARFRLDETRIKGTAARVQCRKCGNPIYVTKPEAATPRAESSLDLRSLLSGPAGSGPEAPSAEPAAAPPPAAASKTPAHPGPESTLDLKSLLEGSSGAPLFAPEPPAGAPASAAGSPAEGEEPADERSAFDVPAATGEPAEPPASEAPAAHEEPADERSAFDIPAATGEPAEPPTFDAAAEPPIEFAPEEALNFGDVPVETATGESTREEPPDVPPPLEPDSIGPEPAPARAAEDTIPLSDIADSLRSRPEPESSPEAESSRESRVDELQDELQGLAGAPGAAAPGPHPPREVDPPPRGAAPPAPKPAARPAARTGARPLVATLGVLFVILAGGGAFLGFTPGGRQVMQGLVSRLEPLIGGGKAPAAAYEVENPVGYYEVAQDAAKMFIVKGQVKNVGRAPKSGVRIHAAILDAAAREIAQKSAYAGNIVTTDGLKKAGREKLEAELSNRFGENLVNMDIAPGKSIPFMVIFFDAPDGIDAFKVEAGDGD